MKKIMTTILVAAFLLTTTAWPAQVQAADNESEPSYKYEEGYETGWQDGWKTGFHDGEKSGYEEGYEDGYVDGCESGYNAGVESGVDEALEAMGCEDDGVKEAILNNLYWERYYEETPEDEWEDSDYELRIEELPEYPESDQNGKIYNKS